MSGFSQDDIAGLFGLSQGSQDSAEADADAPQVTPASTARVQCAIVSEGEQTGCGARAGRDGGSASVQQLTLTHSRRGRARAALGGRDPTALTLMRCSCSVTQADGTLLTLAGGPVAAPGAARVRTHSNDIQLVEGSKSAKLMKGECYTCGLVGHFAESCAIANKMPSNRESLCAGCKQYVRKNEFIVRVKIGEHAGKWVHSTCGLDVVKHELGAKAVSGPVAGTAPRVPTAAPAAVDWWKLGMKPPPIVHDASLTLNEHVVTHVVVVGLSGHTAMNGQLGEVVEHKLGEVPRAVVKLTGVELYKSIKPVNLRIIFPAQPALRPDEQQTEQQPRQHTVASYHSMDTPEQRVRFAFTHAKVPSCATHTCVTLTAFLGDGLCVGFAACGRGRGAT